MSYKTVSGAALLLALFTMLALPHAAKAQQTTTAATPKPFALGTLLQDGAVLQMGAPVRIYGTGTPGKRVVVAVAEQSAEATVDSNGRWRVTLSPLKAGGPHTLTATSGGETVMIGNVLIGEVWVCSGQSNMEWSVNSSLNAQETVASANDDQLRMFIVPRTMQTTPQENLPGGSWLPAIPANVGRFSAVGYHFARELRRSRNVPIGMVMTAWGGTRIQAWTKRATLETLGYGATEFDALNENGQLARARKARYERLLAMYKAAGSPQDMLTDKGVAEIARDWAKPDISTTDWKPVRVAQNWEKAGVEEIEAVDGTIWFRKEITVPSGLADKLRLLHLGAIDDADVTYVNGVKVGETVFATGESYKKPRVYTVPANVLKDGKNIIAVRVFDASGDGGLTGPANRMFLGEFPDRPDGTSTARVVIPPTGWTYKTESMRAAMPELDASLNPNLATVLYNAMLAPLTRYTIKGAIWYQGESNTGESERYAALMPAMIQNWRDDWGVGEFPFYMVQLAPFGSGNSSGLWYAGLRESQWHTTKVLKNVGMAVITDVGDEKDIHPRDKKTVGERLALLARKQAYKERNVDAATPEPLAIKINVGVTQIRFANVGAGLRTRSETDKSVLGFTCIVDNGMAISTKAEIVGKDTINVATPPGTKAIHFGFVNYDGSLNLFNSAGVPATPFRSDLPSWFGKTATTPVVAPKP